ncbi:MAG: hypothetical protein ACR652_03945 [Methylocystis sp.]|uniref:hypothetical protein n=1 Tax=Methylocystis sp. TaxID=1911079 RepID=UPI003DA64CFC
MEMAGRQKEISVSEFFLKNRHLLGFDTPAKSLVTAGKAAVDNALDACEEAGVLPEITVEVRGRFERSWVDIISRIESEPLASEHYVSTDTASNRPDIHKRRHIAWSRPHGTRVEMEIEGVNQAEPKAARFRSSWSMSFPASAKRRRARSSNSPANR